MEFRLVGAPYNRFRRILLNKMSHIPFSLSERKEKFQNVCMFACIIFNVDKKILSNWALSQLFVPKTNKIAHHNTMKTNK